MRHMIMTVTALTVFAFGMSASMAQHNSSPMKVNPPLQPSPQMQTQPAPLPNLNTSKNPYGNPRYAPEQLQKK
jgi:hypothetical protein